MDKYREYLCEIDQVDEELNGDWLGSILFPIAPIFYMAKLPHIIIQDAIDRVKYTKLDICSYFLSYQFNILYFDRNKFNFDCDENEQDPFKYKTFKDLKWQIRKVAYDSRSPLVCNGGFISKAGSDDLYRSFCCSECYCKRNVCIKPSNSMEFYFRIDAKNISCLSQFVPPRISTMAYEQIKKIRIGIVFLPWSKIIQ